MRRTLVLALAIAVIVTGCTSGLKRPVEEVTAQAGTDGVQHVRIEAHSFYFSPNRVIVKAGVPVELTIKNTAFGVPHNITCFEQGAGIDLSEDVGMFRGQKHATFTPTEPGEYEFYCHVDSHGKKGMKGTIVVVQ